MFGIFRTRVGAKIILGYLASVSLMIVVGVLVAGRLSLVAQTVNALTNNLAVELDLTNAIVKQIVLTHLYANHYIQSQNQKDLDAYQVSASLLQDLLAESDRNITNSDRRVRLGSLKEHVSAYDASFEQISALLAERTRLRSEVIRAKEVFIELQLAGLRVSISSGNNSAQQLAVGNVQDDFREMRINGLEYIDTGDERFAALFDLNYQQTLMDLADFNKTSVTPAQRQISVDVQNALEIYAKGFKNIRSGYVQIQLLTQASWDTSERAMNQADLIAAQVKQEFQEENAATNAFVFQTQVVLVAAILGAVIIGLSLGWVISRRITMPLRQVAQMAQLIAKVDVQTITSELISLSQGKPAHPLNLTALPLAIELQDEVGQTGRAFNEIIDSLHVVQGAFGSMTTYLNEMAGAAQKVARGDLNAQISPRSTDDMLGNSIFHMLTNLRAAQKEVQETQENLESLVEERTQELRIAKEAAEGANEQLSKLSITVEQSPNSVIITDLYGGIEYVNPAFTQISGYTLEEVKGQKTSLFKSGFTPLETYQDLWATITAGNVWRGELRNCRKSGALYWEATVIAPIYNAENVIAHYVSVKEDITARKQAEDELRHSREEIQRVNVELETALVREMQLARTDTLTGVNNRRYFFELAGHAFDVAQRYQQPLAMIMFDLDHFKNVNDTFGHAAGDQVLQKTAHIVSTEIRTTDVMGRYGGEEFVVVLPMTDAPQAYQLGERIREIVAATRVPTSKGHVTVTLSIGIAEMLHSDPLESAENMVGRADKALYAAKQAGRNRTVIASPE